MKKFLCALLFLTAPAVANAQAIVSKSPVVSGYPQKCGWYVGVNAEAGAGAVPNAPAGTNVFGGDIGAGLGYACAIGNIPYFAEALADFQNLNGGSVGGFSLTGPVHLEQRAGVQTPLLQFLPVLGFPSTGTIPNLPVLPPGVTQTGVAANYFYGAIDEDDISAGLGLATGHAWLVSPEFGTGLLFPLKLSNGMNMVADTWAGVELQSSSVCLGATGMCPKLGTRYKTGVSFKF
jgi:hypothetical protein